MTTTVATPSPGTRTGAVLALTCAAQFVVVLDVAVVNVALPSIRADLGLSADALHWVVVAYSLLLGSFLLLGGGGSATPSVGVRRSPSGSLSSPSPLWGPAPHRTKRCCSPLARSRA